MIDALTVYKIAVAVIAFSIGYGGSYLHLAPFTARQARVAASHLANALLAAILAVLVLG